MKRYLLLCLFMFGSTANAAVSSLDNMALMMVIKSVCQLDPPPGVFDREYKKLVDESGDDPVQLAADIAQAALDYRGKIADDKHDLFCFEVQKEWGPSYFD